jgi:hypothetical protein
VGWLDDFFELLRLVQNRLWPYGNSALKKLELVQGMAGRPEKGKFISNGSAF